MKPDDWARTKAIFDSVILVGKDQRSAYLDKACADDAELRREVESLLAAFDAAEAFMEKPFAGEIADSLLKGGRDELEPGQIFNRYEIVRKIGFGGMGKVYLAADNDLKRSVAIKLLSSEATGDRNRVSRFIREARLASSLNHPNILTIHEIGNVEDVHFIVSEFVTGETLRKRLQRGVFEVGDALDVVIDIASALAVAHRAGIVHRDIKPENVMIREDGLLKLLDFGVAKLTYDELYDADHRFDSGDDVRTEPGLIMGTVKYMSPEQASGGEVDTRTDIWSLGVVLYEMLTGRLPFPGSSRLDVISSIVRLDPRPISASLPSVQRRLWRMIRRALSKSPADRYQTMQEMLDDLKALRTEIRAGSTEHQCIAILPFINISGDPAASFFEFALADAVITELARSGSFVVRPSSSIAKYLGKAIDPLAIANELNVDAILAANFLVTRKRIRVTTQLIDVWDKNVIWGEQIDSDAEDIIKLQDTITHRIVRGLRSELQTSVVPNNSTPVSTNSLAYMEYLRGRDQLRRYMYHTVANENVEIAIGHFKRAIDLDPKFSLAHCALGTSFIQRVIKVEGVQEDLDAAAAAFDEALVLDPQMIDARAYRALITRLQGDVQSSRDQMAELRRDAPNSFEVPYLSAQCFRFDGDYEGSFWCLEEMLRLDPTARVPIHYCRARLYCYQSDFEMAFHELALADKLAPGHPIVKFFHAAVNFRSGNPAAAVDELRALFSTRTCNDGYRPFLSMCLSAAGDREGAERELIDASERVAAVDPDVSYWLACANLMLGRTGSALDWLQRSISLGNHNTRRFESDPSLEPIRSDPRYISLLSGIKSLH